MSKTNLHRFARALFLLALIAGTWLATTPADNAAIATLGDKLTHLLAFGALALLLDFSLSETRFGFWAYKGLPLVAYGLFIEIIQYHLPHRSFDLWDWGADILGIGLYWLARSLVRRLLPPLRSEQT